MKILFVDILTDDVALRKSIERSVYAGRTYSDQCRRALGLSPQEWGYVDATSCAFPNPSIFDAVIIGGSTENPVKQKEDKPWMKKTFSFIRKVKRANIPLLGFCGGLQFTARALGAQVIYNPQGRRIGTQTVTLTAQGNSDPLFTGLPKTFRVAATHRCILKKPLSGWKVLAISALSPNDAIAVGANIRLLQFHPEMSLKNIRSIVRARKTSMTAEGLPPPKLTLPNRAGQKILRNFLRMVNTSTNN